MLLVQIQFQAENIRFIAFISADFNFGLRKAAWGMTVKAWAKTIPMVFFTCLFESLAHIFQKLPQILAILETGGTYVLVFHYSEQTLEIGFCRWFNSILRIFYTVRLHECVKKCLYIIRDQPRFTGIYSLIL